VRPHKTQNPAQAGDGNLLVRDNSSQLCADCHALRTHSSQYSSAAYGNRTVNCRDCHTPHETRNIYLIREQIPTPADGLKDVVLYNLNSLATGTGVGLCETCHTQTIRYKSAGHDPGANGHNVGANCSACHKHQEGFKKAVTSCNTCHNDPPQKGNHYLHYTGAEPTVYGDVTNGSTAAAYKFFCGKCHSGTHQNDTTHDGATAAAAKVVQVIFDATTAPQNPGAAYAVGTAQPPEQNASGLWFSWSNGTCNNLYCHSNAAPRTPAARTGHLTEYKSPRWMDIATSPNCTACHQGAAAYANMVYNAATNPGALSDAHWKHAAGDRYNLGCQRCHNATVGNNTTVSDKSKHVDGLKNVAFDNTGVFNNTGGSYNAAFQCANTYCHSNGQSLTPPFGSSTSAAWNAVAPLACDSCHAGNAANTNKMASGKHAQHINNAAVLGANYKCSQCHFNTTSAATDTIAGYANHVNGVKDVAFDTSGGKTNGTGPNWTSPGTCANVYCHSSGQATPTYRTVPSWAAAGTVLNCKTCHGTETGGLWGEPRYASGGPNLNNSNSHAKHVGAAAGTANCGLCHPATADNNGALMTNTATHTNGLREVAPGGAATFTYAAGKTCNNVSCHNNAGGVVWGQTAASSLPTCLSCHGAAADTNDL
ncbi:MAG: CxxxxCH/CxxCH domain-containing protein, partial [Geobacter sp.]|nr:CxxxxCH/CxxCH domain-containing protein [Geobacter sp.]